MKKRKRILLFTLALAASLILAACGSASSAEETPSEDGKILIAYYSHTGNTEEAAQKIAEFTGGDLAEIRRAEEYEDVYEEAEAEILDGVHPEITVSAENIEEYDTIFVGYPKMEQPFLCV